MACSHVSGDKEQLLVEYIDTTCTTVKSSLVDAPNQHVGTMAYLMTSTSEHSGVKRKLVDSPETDNSCMMMIMIYQLFREQRGITLVRQKVQIMAPVQNGSSWALARAPSRHQTSAVSVNLIADNTGVALSVSHVCALGFVEGNDAITLFYRTTANASAHASHKTNGKTTTTSKSANDEQSFYTSISLRTGRLIGVPILLPTTTKQVGLVGPALLAVLTADREILLFDTIRGAQVCSCRPLPPPQFPDDGYCTLVADSKISRLAIVFVQEDKYAVAFASVRADNDVSMQPLLRGPRLSLAAGLASSLTAPVLSIGQGAPKTLVLETSIAEYAKGKDREQIAVANGMYAKCRY
jgi:hypothetical protein